MELIGAAFLRLADVGVDVDAEVEGICWPDVTGIHQVLAWAVQVARGDALHLCSHPVRHGPRC